MYDLVSSKAENVHVVGDDINLTHNLVFFKTKDDLFYVLDYIETRHNPWVWRFMGKNKTQVSFHYHCYPTAKKAVKTIEEEGLQVRMITYDEIPY